MNIRRFLPITTIVALLAANIPTPARAMSTATEIQIGKQDDQQILDSYTIIKDPLQNQWVNEISSKLWAQVARKDVPYNIKILDVPDVNSFTTIGGYIYINEGALDFVQSDDELAGIIGHETGHNERRHTVTLPAKAQALDLLFGLASLFSPFIYRFGQLAEAGMIAKMSRADELQADQYGLLLMSRAGYDPDAMVSFMRHLDAAYAQHDNIVDKYFADHPGVPDRVSHLLGYHELDPKVRTTDQVLVQALHDQDTARYAIANMKFAQVLKADPGNAVALLHMGQTQLALGQPNKSEQTLAEAAAKGNDETRTAALLGIKSLRANQAKFSLLHPTLQPLRQTLDDAQSRQAQTVAAITTRRDAGKDQLKALNSRLQNITYGLPDLSRIQVRKGSRLEAVVKNLAGMGRSIDIAYGKPQAVIGGVGSLERNKEGGLLKENADILRELQAPLKMDPVPSPSLAILPSYPRMLDDIALSNGDMIRSLDASRASLALLDTGLGDLDTFIKRLARTSLDFGGDISPTDYNALVPLMSAATTSLGKAAVAGSQASQLFNLARSRQLQTRITMLGVGFPQDRYETLRYALNQRVKNEGLDFTTMQHDGLTPGEVAAASIVAADTNTTPAAIVQEAKASKKRIVDIANARGMDAQSLEIFLGLVYLDYADDPDKEAHGHAA
ncbi:MAG: M48 family metalloprotease [Candidatus Eremiobacteraeota bacterium]|nr:M48 family metalloprotease [Candidatus Eremiobacteraeota bacterium]